jgi:transposase
LLRGGADRIRAVLAANGDGHRVRGDSAIASAGKARRSSKTDRRDAERLASSYQAGTLTVVWVPDPKHEALRDLVRAREAAKQATKRAKHRLGKYLLRYGQRPGNGAKAWTAVWWQWVRKLELPHAEQNTTLLELILEVDHQSQRVARHDGAIDQAVASAPEHLRAIVTALQALRGVAQETAVTVALEFGSFSRFERAPQAMGYTRLVSSEYTSGSKKRQVLGYQRDQPSTIRPTSAR